MVWATLMLICIMYKKKEKSKDLPTDNRRQNFNFFKLFNLQYFSHLTYPSKTPPNNAIKKIHTKTEAQK